MLLAPIRVFCPNIITKMTNPIKIPPPIMYPILRLSIQLVSMALKSGFLELPNILHHFQSTARATFPH
jgi:hypothetical protein